jgi:1-acyl-sn-glycerol-3-phosphate acyltransferase
MMTWFYGPGSVVTLGLVRIVGGVRVEGAEHVPPKGPFILASNHTSLADPPILGATVGHRNGRLIHFMARHEIRRWPLIGWLADKSGVFFVRRGESDRAAQRLALRLLAEGRPIAIFPEGTRSRDGRLGTARPGVALLALRSGVPVLPVAIAGTHRIFPGGSRFPHRSPVTVRIGAPFVLGHRPEGRLDREALRVGTERVMEEIAAFLPPAQRPTAGAVGDATDLAAHRS